MTHQNSRTYQFLEGQQKAFEHARTALRQASASVGILMALDVIICDYVSVSKDLRLTDPVGISLERTVLNSLNFCFVTLFKLNAP